MSSRGSAKHWIREIIQQQVSYHVPLAGDYIKIDAMENPWPMPSELNQQWRDALADMQLNRYPDPQASEVVDKLREVMNIPADASVMLGNGSDELIQAILLALAGEKRCVIAPTPTFVMYEVLAIACGLEFVGVPQNSDFTLDMEAMHEAIKQHDPAVIFLASPNNPTGRCFSQSAVEEVLRLAPGLVVVDEAYQPFMNKPDTSFMSRLPDYPDLIVMRTLSKIGLAGIRLGLIAGHPDWITELDKLRLPYNINSLTQATAAFALDHWKAFQKQIDAICDERERVSRSLAAMPGIKTWPSETNFILFRVSGIDAEAVQNELLEKGVLIKCLHKPDTVLENCLRVTIGTPDENNEFLAQLAEVLA